jgi:uncharacterized membrane protein YeiH
MMEIEMIMNISTWIGDIAFLIGGILAARNIGCYPIVQFFSGMFVAFGGGFVRDLLVLHTPEAIKDRIPEIGFVAVVGLILTTIIWLKDKKGKKVDSILGGQFGLVIADSIGVGAFSITGYNLGIQNSVGIALLCGWMTACGGGILAAALRAVYKKSIILFGETLIENGRYYLFGAAMTGLYSIYMPINPTQLLTLIVIGITIGVLSKFGLKLPNLVSPMNLKHV